jgi:hypothetical protein
VPSYSHPAAVPNDCPSFGQIRAGRHLHQVSFSFLTLRFSDPTVFCDCRRLVTLIYTSLSITMRPLTEEESKTLFAKLANYLGKNLLQLLSSDVEPCVFRLHRDRVYYVSEVTMKLATSVARPNLVSLGTCLGKFSKSGKFRLHISSLDVLAKYATYKVSTNTGRGNKKKKWRNFWNAGTRRMRTDLYATFSGMDQAEWGNAVLVREPCTESAPWSDNGGYSRTSGSGCVQHVGCSTWFRCHCAKYRRHTED